MASDWTAEIPGILFESSFLTLATADGDGLPWASPLEFACDENLRFYWVSMVDARHARNIRANPWAAFSIFDCTQTPGATAVVQGVYGEGPVEELSPFDVEAIWPSIARWISRHDAERERPGPPSEHRLDDPDSPWRVYRVDPTSLFALDPNLLDEGRLVEARVEVDLTESFARAYRSRLA